MTKCAITEEFKTNKTNIEMFTVLTINTALKKIITINMSN